MKPLRVWFLVSLLVILSLPNSVFADQVPSWLEVGHYINYVGKLENDPTVYTSYYEIVEINPAENWVKYRWTQPNADIDTEIELDFNNPVETFFLTQTFLQRLKRESIYLPDRDMTYVYRGMEYIGSPIGALNCYKIEWWIGQGANQIKGIKYVDEYRGVTIKNVYLVPGSGSFELSVSQTNIVSGVTPLDAATDSVEDLAFGGIAGGIATEIGSRLLLSFGYDSLVGGVASGLGASIGPAILGGMGASFTTSIAKKSLGWGMPESVVLGAVSGTLINVAALVAFSTPIGAGAVITSLIVTGLISYVDYQYGGLFNIF